MCASGVWLIHGVLVQWYAVNEVFTIAFGPVPKRCKKYKIYNSARISSIKIVFEGHVTINV